jgi:hypothetical protein
MEFMNQMIVRDLLLGRCKVSLDLRPVPWNALLEATQGLLQTIESGSFETFANVITNDLESTISGCFPELGCLPMTMMHFLF